MQFAIDIGSTTIKVREIDNISLKNQFIYKRDYTKKVNIQVEKILEDIDSNEDDFLICSSANGGIKVGIISLTSIFSGQLAHNIASSSGANVLFNYSVSSFKEENLYPNIDILIVTGGIDCDDKDLISSRLLNIDLANIQFRSLVFAGNKFLFSKFQKKYPKAIHVDNPLDEHMRISSDKLGNLIRNHYLDDIIQKDGMTSLKKYTNEVIWSTPMIVNIAFQNLSKKIANNIYPSPFIVMDIGGATTDIHFGIEVVHSEIGDHDSILSNFNRHVFTDLGVYASRDSTIKRLQNHDKLLDFISCISNQTVYETHDQIEKGEINKTFLFYACIFMALDAVSNFKLKDSPNLDIERLEGIIITGGASQYIEEDKIKKIIKMLMSNKNTSNSPNIYVDKEYQLWAQGIMSIKNFKNDPIN